MYAWLSTSIGADATRVASYIAIIIALFAIVWLCFAFFRRMNIGIFHIIGKKHNTRLSVRDATALDNRRRLVLVRRDDIEHLILVGGPSDVVVEFNINAPDSKRQAENNKKRADPVLAAPASPKAETKGKAIDNRIEEKAPVPVHPSQMAKQREREEEQYVYQPEAVPGQNPQYAQAAPQPHVYADMNQPVQQHYSQQNGVSHAEVNQQPPPPQIQTNNTHNSPYFAGNRPAMQKAPASQMPPSYQRHKSAPGATAPAAPSVNRPQQPMRQTPINIQAVAGNMRQTAAPRPAPPRTNGTPGHVSSYYNYPVKTAANNSTQAMPKNNGSNGHANGLKGDHPGMNPNMNTTHKPMAARKEPVLDLSQRKQDPGFSKAGSPSEEDFDKILQKELMRS